MQTDQAPAEGRLRASLDDLSSHRGANLGPTAWRTVTQQQVDSFAALTGDHNPIHIDPDFAATTPFGGTIAHGFLTLSLLADLTSELLQVDGFSLAVNYGLEKVRFPAPVPVGTEIRATAELIEVTEIESGVQIVLATAVEVKGTTKPACVATCVFRYYA